MAELNSSPVSTKSPLPNELSIMEEGKNTPFQEPTIDSPTNIHKMVAELVGTYILIFAGCGSILIDQIHPITPIGVAVVWGLAVMVLIYTLGHVSGAHFNPAVTVAFATSRQLPWKHVPTYITCQLLGSILAMLTLYGLLHRDVPIAISVSRSSSSTTILEALIWEFIVSFILMFTVCGVATDHRAINEVSGVAVGAAVLLNVLIAGPTSGASMNPARSIGPALISGDSENLWVYILGPTLGTITAAMVYNFIRMPVPDKSNQNTKNV